MTKFRYAVLSDIHSNLTALVAVMNEADKSGPYDEILCAGDVAGYGANPNECIMLLEKARAKIVRGNHDRAVSGGDSSRFNSDAKAGAMYNASVLTHQSRRFLEKLRPYPYVSETFAMVHGSFYGCHEDTDISALEDAVSAFVGLKKLERRVGIVGHTHIPLHVSCSGVEGKLDFVKNPKGERHATTLAEGAPAYLLFNPGSVGQPRNGSPEAAWGIMEIDGDDVMFDFRRTKYDVEKTQRRMRNAGLPGVLSDRLSHGR